MKTIVLRKTKIIENFEKEVETETQRKQNSRKTVSVVGMDSSGTPTWLIFLKKILSKNFLYFPLQDQF